MSEQFMTRDEFNGRFDALEKQHGGVADGLREVKEALAKLDAKMDALHRREDEEREARIRMQVEHDQLIKERDDNRATFRSTAGAIVASVVGTLIIAGGAALVVFTVMQHGVTP